MTEQTKPIPQPPPKLIVGNIFDVDPENGIQSICDLMKTYGPIMKLAILNKKIVTVGNQALVHEVCDQSRFEKIVQGPLEHVRVLAGDGLFTAHQREESWDIAHRILVPAFGPLSIRNMFPGMVDIADQLVAKWHRFAGQKIDVVADFTRLTLDTIAFCTFSHRFNSFYSETSPPFVEAMFRSLKASGVRNRRLPGTSWAYRASDKQLAEDVKLQHDTADELVKERVESKEDKGDLLDVMLKGRDPKTGKGLSQENIRYQLVTFLIAGHETTSGMLSFLFHYLLQHPEAARKIKEEVDRVAGSGPIEYSHLQKFEYIDAALKETLRLRSTAPAFSVTPKNGPEIIGGSYLVEKGQSVVVVLDALHRDPGVWGNDAEEFRPERMLNDGFKNLPPDAWKPFGNGMRGCIGRPFAWQESLLVVAMHFDFRPYNPSYELKIKTALTIKPNEFYMYIQPRKDRQFTASSLQPASGSTGTSSTTPEDAKVENAGGKGPKLYVYYGSNAGTCKALAQKLVDTSSRRGVKVEISQLNDASDGHLPRDGPVAIITASYDGQPTDDANFFYQWLIKAEGDAAKGIKYGVFGCGHPDWHATFHAVPTKIDERLTECGGQRLVARGSGNAAASELFEEFDDWEETFLKSAFSSDISTASAEKDTLVATVDKESRQNTLSYGHLQPALVVSNEVISQDSKEIKRHISIKLPVGTTYRTGDYMALLPTTPRPFVMRALNRFKLHPDDAITLQGGGKTFNLPLNTSISAFDLFAGFVELSQPVSIRRIERLVELLRDDGEGLKKYLDPTVFEAEIVQKRISFLDLLEEFPDIDIPLGEFLLALPPIRLRQYSVSSSPLDDPTMATLTISAIASPHLSGRGTMYYGTATTFLSNCIPGTYIRMSIRPSSSAFHPPLDPSVPVLMGCAGSGIAPFRGFVQERALQKAAGRNVGKALLFYGCHGPTTDALYDEEMKKWEAEGVVSVRHAFSRSTEDSKGCKYVQDRIWHDREEAKEMFHNGARVYICGSTPLAKGVKEVCARIYAEHKAVDISAAEEWMRSIEAERFATDVFA